MQRRRLGGLEVSAVGLGCATMTPFHDEPDRDAAIDTLRRAREIGVDFLDSSDAYGQGRNEELIARAVKGYRHQYVIASKFGNLRARDGSPTSDGRAGIRQGVLRAQPEAVRNRCHRPLLHPSC
jgi:aryl-alcohol dehydrogenase-like predicted oxidoreductase